MSCCFRAGGANVREGTAEGSSGGRGCRGCRIELSFPSCAAVFNPFQPWQLWELDGRWQAAMLHAGFGGTMEERPGLAAPVPGDAARYGDPWGWGGGDTVGKKGGTNPNI